MSTPLSRIAPRTLKDVTPWAALALCLVVLAASLLLHERLFHATTGPAAMRPGLSAPGTAAAPSATATVVSLSEGKWKTAGIQVGRAEALALPSEVGVPGRIEANPDRRVEVRPRAPGVVREVRATLGQAVKKGDVLVVLESPDLGTARLNLRGRQIELATARTELDWKQQVAANVARLIPELRKGVAASEIQKRYADHPLGSNRALLVQAYSEYEIASHEDEKTTKLYREKIVGEHPAFLAMHTREGAQARFEAQLEQVKFDASHELTLAEQKVQLAEAAVIDAAQRLRILGVAVDIEQALKSAGDIAATRSSAVEDVTTYVIVAPFDGTIITRTVAPSQKAEVNDVLFIVADLSTVWVMANVPESDFAVISSLKNGTIRFAATAYPTRTFDARLLSVGAMVDPASRTVPIMAETRNPEGILKLEMFVRIVLDGPSTEQAIVVPSAAVVEIEGKHGVFVPDRHEQRTVAFHPVTLGREMGDRRVVASGLGKGDTVVTAGAYFLKSELILQNETEED